MRSGLTLKPRINQQGAVSLIEVLVALIVLTFGILGLAGMQLSSLQANTSALMRTQATELAYDVMDRMRANRFAALKGDYDAVYAIDKEEEEPPPEDTQSQGAPPPNKPLAELDVEEWQGLLAGALPSGDGQIVSNSGLVSITVRWSEDWADDADADGFVYLDFKSEI